MVYVVPATFSNRRWYAVCVGMFIGIGAVGSHFQLVHAIAIVILLIEPASVLGDTGEAAVFTRQILSICTFIRDAKSRIVVGLSARKPSFNSRFNS